MSKPFKGDLVSCSGKTGRVLSVDRDICFVQWESGIDCFIWRFSRDGTLNSLHDWDRKHVKEEQ